MAPDDPAGAPPRRALGWTFLASVATSGGMAALSLVTGVLTARLLGTDGRGQVAAISTWLLTLTWMSSLSFTHGLAFYRSRGRLSDGEALSTALISVPILGLLGVLAAQVLIPYGFSAQSQETQDLARLFLCGIPLVVGLETCWDLLMAYHRFRFLNATRLAQPAVYALALVALAVTDRFTVTWVLLWQVASWGIVFLTTIAVLIRQVGLSRPRWDVSRQSFRYGLRLQGVALGHLVTARLDLMLLPAFVTAAAIGYYSIAVNVTSLVMSVFGGLAMIVFPVASRAERHAMGPVVESGLRMALAGGFALVLAIGLSAPWLVPFVYGADFAGAVLPLWLLLPGVLLWCANTIVSAGLEALDMPGRASLAQIAGIVVTVIGLLISLPRWGIVGAAVTSSVAYAATFLISTHLLRRTRTVSLRSALHPQLMARDTKAMVRQITVKAGARRGGA